MWQADTFDTTTISRELGYASSIGMNCVRVFLDDLAYEEDPQGFLKRMDTFLSIADRYGIKTLFVFFDSCWNPFPFVGPQPAPVLHRHNSRWVQSPGYLALKDSLQYPRLEKYVKQVVRRFGKDQRILGWDVWNEPDNINEGSYEKEELPGKLGYVLPLLKKSFRWVRSEHPTQPITSAIWKLYDSWTPEYKPDSIEKIQLEESDIISFHYYGNGKELEKRIQWLQQLGKPVWCTEYLARDNGSTFEDCLPVLKKYQVAAFNWGLVAGKTNTIYPWDSWQKEYKEPKVWHHDIFRKDGTPYNKEEVELISDLSKNINDNH